LSSAGQTVAIRVDQVLDIGCGCNHVISVSLDPGLSVQPRKHLLEELVGVTLSDAELGDPYRLVEGGVELLEVVLEVFGVVPGVVVSNDEVDLASRTLVEKLLEVVDTLASRVGVGDGWGADPQTLFSQGLDVLLMGGDSSGDVDVGTSATVCC
jgi:hypothetical protein